MQFDFEAERAALAPGTFHILLELLGRPAQLLPQLLRIRHVTERALRAHALTLVLLSRLYPRPS